MSFMLHLCCKKLLCYILLQGKDRHDVNKYVVVRDEFDNTKDSFSIYFYGFRVKASRKETLRSAVDSTCRGPNSIINRLLERCHVH